MLFDFYVGTFMNFHQRKLDWRNDIQNYSNRVSLELISMGFCR